ncbi:MAG: 6-pyruvoyl trahydropterin synthase family protein [Chloroflexota bacterium]
MLRISKTFRWEMSHRLPFHKGLCVNLHGHSYRMRVMLEGEPNENGMIIDFYDLDTIFGSIVEKLDHSFLADSTDAELAQYMKSRGYKVVETEKYSTLENIVFLIGGMAKDGLSGHKNVKRMEIRIYESEDAFCETEIEL